MEKMKLYEPTVRTMHIQEKRKFIIQKIDNMPDGDLSDLFEFIQSLENKNTKTQTHFASEKVLAKDWNKEEEKAWKDL